MFPVQSQINKILLIPTTPQPLPPCAECDTIERITESGHTKVCPLYFLYFICYFSPLYIVILPGHFLTLSRGPSVPCPPHLGMMRCLHLPAMSITNFSAMRWCLHLPATSITSFSAMRCLHLFATLITSFSTTMSCLHLPTTSVTNFGVMRRCLHLLATSITSFGMIRGFHVGFHTDMMWEGETPSPLCFFPYRCDKQGVSPSLSFFFPHRHNVRGETPSLLCFFPQTRWAGSFPLSVIFLSTQTQCERGNPFSVVFLSTDTISRGFSPLHHIFFHTDATQGINLLSIVFLSMQMRYEEGIFPSLSYLLKYSI